MYIETIRQNWNIGTVAFTKEAGWDRRAAE